MSKRSFLLSTLGLTGLILACLGAGPELGAKEMNRFAYSGDGVLQLNGQSIVFRQVDGSYNTAGLKKIHIIFGAPFGDPAEQLSLRFLEILDYVQDHFGGGSYSLKSGYRSPNSNQKLRNQGKLAAQSSMHIEGAAADMMLQGTNSSEVFDFVKYLDCCGIGWYHSKHFHIDTGPSRYWDETSSKTEDKTPQQNEKIILQPDFDRYRAGEEIALKFMRVSEYPIGVPASFDLVKLENGQATDTQKLPVLFKDSPAPSACQILESRSQARNLSVRLPQKNLKPGSYAIRVSFCERYAYEKMPAEILTRSFQILE